MSKPPFNLYKLLSLYNSSKPDNVYHAICETLLKNLDRVSTLSIYELAELSSTSLPTISRFVKMLGHKSYPHFKSSLALMLSDYRFTDRAIFPDFSSSGTDYTEQYLRFLEARIQAIRENLQSVDLNVILPAIHVAQKVHIYCPYLTKEVLCFQFDLIKNGKEVLAFDDPGAHLLDAQDLDSDSIAIITLPGGDFDVISLMEAVKQTGAKVLLICPTVFNLYSKFADYIIYLSCTETRTDEYLVGVLINILDINYRGRYID